MDLNSFVNSLTPGAFYHLMAACSARMGRDLGYIDRSGTLLSAEAYLAREGNKLQAVKSVKERLNIGIKEAKDLVDAYCSRVTKPPDNAES